MTDSRCSSVSEQAAPHPLALQARLDGLGHLVEGDVGGGGAPLALGLLLHRTDPVDRPAVRQRHHPGGRAALSGSNLDAVRQTSSSTSWVTSSDWAGSRITLLTMPNTDSARRS